MNIRLTLYEIVGFIWREPLRAFLDIFSHFATGVILANIFFRNKSTRFKVFVGFVGGFLPDFDFFLQMFGIMRHGTFTHTFFFLIPLVVGGAIFFPKPFTNKLFLDYSMFVSLCVMLHIIADFASNYVGQILYVLFIGCVYFVSNRIIMRESQHTTNVLENPKDAN